MHRQVTRSRSRPVDPTTLGVFTAMLERRVAGVERAVEVTAEHVECSGRRVVATVVTARGPAHYPADVIGLAGGMIGAALAVALDTGSG